MSNLIRFAPGNVRSLQGEFDRLFDGLLSTRTDEAASAMWAPRVDLLESDDAYVLEVDVPGLKRDDININFHDQTLTISGERSSEKKEEKKGEYVRVERQYGNFYRSFTLPRSVDSNKIEASYENGVLIVTVPKAEESKPRKIDVR
jgi:HSP20 family protein